MGIAIFLFKPKSTKIELKQSNLAKLITLDLEKTNHHSTEIAPTVSHPRQHGIKNCEFLLNISSLLSGAKV
jgi:hypothetical protein